MQVVNVNAIRKTLKLRTPAHPGPNFVKNFYDLCLCLSFQLLYIIYGIYAQTSSKMFLAVVIKLNNNNAYPLNLRGGPRCKFSLKVVSPFSWQKTKWIWRRKTSLAKKRMVPLMMSLKWNKINNFNWLETRNDLLYLKNEYSRKTFPRLRLWRLGWG